MAKQRIPRWLSVVLVGAAATLSACDGKFDYQVLEERGVAYVDARPELDAETRASILGHTLRAGMSKSDVVAAWGRPVRIYKFSDGQLEEWIFGCDYPHICHGVDGGRRRPRIFREVQYQPRAYFEDGMLTDWRD